MGYSKKKVQTGGLRIWNFQGYQRNSLGNFQELIKNQVKFLRVTKKNRVEFPGVFVFGLGISKGSNTILWNIQELSGIYRGKVKNEKFQGVYEKSISSPPLFGSFLE